MLARLDYAFIITRHKRLMISANHTTATWPEFVLSALAFIVLCLAAPPLSAQSETDTAAQATPRNVVAAIPSSWPPQYSQDDDGNPAGFAIDVMNEIAAQAGVTVTYRNYDNFAEVSEAMNRGEADLVPNSGITPDRATAYLFTAPIETFEVSIFVRVETTGIKSLENLIGRRVGVVKNNVSEKLLRARDDIDAVVHPDLRTAVFDLLAGQQDALVFPKPVLLALSRKIGIEDDIKTVGASLKEIKRAIRVQMDEPELHAVLDQAVNEFVGSPAYQRIYVKWYGTAKPFWTIARVTWVLSALSSMVLIIMAWGRHKTVLKLNRNLRHTITERELAEAANRREKNRAEKYLEISEAMIVALDAEGNVVRINRRGCDILGYSDDVIVGRNWIDMIIPEELRAEIAAVHANTVGGHVAPVEYYENEVVTKSGERRSIAWHNTLARDDNGTIIGSLSSGQDITEHKLAIEALRESEARFKQAAHLANLGHWSYDEIADRFEYVSEEIAHIQGISVAEYLTSINSTEKDIARAHPDDRERYGAALRYAQNNGTAYDVTYKLERPDGEIRHVRELGEPILDESGRLVRSVGTVQDITEIKQAEEALRENEALLRLITNNLPAAIVYVDSELRFRFANDLYTTWYGTPADDILGHHIREFFDNDEEERFQSFQPFFDAALAGEMVRHEFVSSLHNGRSLDVDATLVPNFDEHGVVLGLVCLILDVSSRKRAEDELIAAKEQADFASRSKSEFLATMSHELRTPLNAIIGFSDMMKGEMFGPLGDTKYTEYAKDINRSGVHLLDLINDILDLSKIEAGKAELREEEVDVSAVLQSCLTLTEQVANAGDIVVVCNTASDLPTLFCDERKLKQIVINLLSNAVKFTPRGGRVVAQLRIGSDDDFEIQVADTGIGIAYNDIPKALSPFSQIDSDLNRKYEGTGLGLPLTTALVELHGGSLTLHSTVGVGTTVTARFPAERIVWDTAPAQNGVSAAG
jgi:PAS domain S-box-containing protein